MTKELNPPGKDASLEEIEAYFRSTLVGLKTEGDYHHESDFTKKWNCAYCGTRRNPCSMPCIQCGRDRPAKNQDKEIEGGNEDGELRLQAQRERPKGKRNPLT